MPFTTLESLLSVLESGNVDEKQVALSHLLNAARNGTVFDVDRLIICLINADHVDTVQKIFVLLSHLAIRDDSCKRKLCKISAIYHLVLKILTSESVKEIIAVFYFLLSILHLDESADVSESLEEIKIAINEAKEKVRDMGILNQICTLFLQSSSDSAVWQSLCQCLAECCTGTIKNQNESLHILPKCLQQLGGCFKLDLINLVIALIYNNPINQERFILLGGIQCIARNFLNTHKGIELLCVSMSNYPCAVQEANICNLVPQLEAIYAKSNVIDPSINQVMLSKWCSLALWILAKPVPQNADDFNKLYKNPLDLLKNDKYSSEKVKKRLFQTENSKISNNMENSAKNTLGSSFLSKFDAINSFPSSPPNKIQPSLYNFNQVHPHFYKTSQETRGIQGKDLLKGWKMSFKRNNDKENFTFIPQSDGESSYTNSSNRNIKSFISNDVDDETNKESIDETFQDFKPAFTSSPLQMDGSNVLKTNQGNKSIFKIPAYPKRFEDEFHGQLLKSISERQITYKNKPQSESIETTKSITASPKVCQLVKQVIGSQKKLQSINGNNNNNIVFYLKQEGWTRVSNISQFEKENKIENDSRDNVENSNKILGFKISVEHNNNTREEPQLQKTVPETSISKCVLVGSQTRFENSDPGSSGSNNASIKSNKSNFMNPFLKNVIKRLKIGVSLYGCDFQKISNALWSKKEHVSAKFLHDVYCKHIAKNEKKINVRKHPCS